MTKYAAIRTSSPTIIAILIPSAINAPMQNGRPFRTLAGTQPFVPTDFSHQTTIGTTQRKYTGVTNAIVISGRLSKYCTFSEYEVEPIPPDNPTIGIIEDNKPAKTVPIIMADKICQTIFTIL